MLKFTNNASATLAGSITSTATTVILTAGNGSLFPALGAGDYCFATLVDSSNNLEIVKITARSGDTLTVERSQDSTTARGYAAGDKCELRLVAAVFNETLQRDGSIAMTGNLAAGGNKVTGLGQGTASGEAVHAGRQVLTSSNLTGGGNLTADRTLDLSDTGVGAGSVGSSSAIPILTIDAKGRVTAKSTAALDLSPKMDKDGTVNPIIRNQAPTILLNDTDQNVTKKIHHNSDLIGFLSNDDNWLMYGNNAGQIWSRTYGWLHENFFSTVSNCGYTAKAGNISQPTISNCLYLGDGGSNVSLTGTITITANCNCACNC
jgi:hypothetical protein